MSEKLKQAIAHLQASDDDRWFHDGQEEFFKLAEFLLSKGLTEDEVQDVLSKAYRVVANEYGE